MTGEATQDRWGDYTPGPWRRVHHNVVDIVYRGWSASVRYSGPSKPEALEHRMALRRDRDVLRAERDRFETLLNESQDLLDAARGENERLTKALDHNHGCVVCAGDVGIPAGLHAGLCRGHADEAEARAERADAALERVHVALNNLCSATTVLIGRLHTGGWLGGADSTGVMLSVRAALDDARAALERVLATVGKSVSGTALGYGKAFDAVARAANCKGSANDGKPDTSEQSLRVTSPGTYPISGADLPPGAKQSEGKP